MAFTYFFRDMATLELVARDVIPSLRKRRYLTIWDAGCANGAEAYSLAMMLRENMGEFLFRNVRIYATDVEAMFGEVIQRAVYREEEVQRIPAPLLGRYFIRQADAGPYMLTEPMRKAVVFQQHDLRSRRPIRGGFALIVCKNVLLHLQPEEVVGALSMFRDALDDDGFLVTEQTQKLPPETVPWFEQVTPEAQILRRRPRVSSRGSLTHDAAHYVT